MQIGEAAKDPARDMWTLAVHGARSSELINAVDPAISWVVLEGHSPARGGWRELPLPITSDASTARMRTARTVRFDLLLSPDELFEIGPLLDTADQGWLFLWQASRRPPDYLALDQKEGPARFDAMSGLGVSLLIDLPHDQETAVLTFLDLALLNAAAERLQRSQT